MKELTTEGKRKTKKKEGALRYDHEITGDVAARAKHKKGKAL